MSLVRKSSSTKKSTEGESDFERFDDIKTINYIVYDMDVLKEQWTADKPLSVETELRKYL